jgi:hypothetical protein
MSALEAAAAVAPPPPASALPQKLFKWEEVFFRAPQMAATMARYLDQLGVSARPGTLRAYDDALRMFAGHITTFDPACRSVSAVEHRHVEAHKTWMASRPGQSGGKLSAATISHRLCLLRTFFVERNDGNPFDRRTIHRYVAAAASEPAWVTSTLTSCATPSPPKRSTGA